MSAARTGVVIATRDRRDNLVVTLERLSALPEAPPIVLVDNGSRDGTPAAVRERFPHVGVVEAGRNLGAAGRNLGVRRLGTRYVSFSDDDSWWAPGALDRAEELLDRHPALGLIAARILVGAEQRLDPTCEEMARSPLRAESGRLPGPPVLGFVACGVIVRRAAFLAAGGFDPRYGVGGEERLLAFDLAAGGWELAYVPEIVAYHHPRVQHDRSYRTVVELRNDLWSAWLRRPLGAAVRRTLVLCRERGSLPGVLAALRGLPWVMRERRAVPPAVERRIRELERSG